MKKTSEKTKATIADFFSEDELKMFTEGGLENIHIVELLKYFNGDALAAVVWYQKYANRELDEKHPDDMHIRLASGFYDVEKEYTKRDRAFFKEYEDEVKDNLSEYGHGRKSLNDDDIFAMFHNFSTVIPQGSVMSQLGVNSIGSLSNCFVAPAPSDSYGGIFKTDQTLAQTAKRRGGVGVDISELRPNGAPTSNVAKTSTGAVSFMERFSNTIREVAQAGRRGALMITINVEHPDIEDFVTIKQDLTKVTGANISVKVSDAFMKAVEKDEEYCLRWPVDARPITRFEEKIGELISKDGNFYRFINAKELWDTMIASAHKSAEPGVLFWTRMRNNSPDGYYPRFAPISTNPCGEIPLPAYDSCRLIALNLMGFVNGKMTDKAEFNYEKFYSTVYETMRLSDDLVDLEIDAVQTIIDKVKSDPEDASVKQVELEFWEKAQAIGKEGRRTGLGFTALGDAAAMLDLKYGSEDFIEFVESIMETKFEAELDCSIDMAITRGPFEGWDPAIEFHEIDGKLYGMNAFYQMIATEFPDQARRMHRFGRRNISWSTVAPTGSLSMLAQVTSGIEPLFKPYYTRRKKIMGGKDIEADFVDANGDRWTEHVVVHEQFKQWVYNNTTLSKNSRKWTEKMLENVFEKSPWFDSTAEDVNWKDRVDTQAAIQKYTSHSISSTINLPSTATPEDIDKIYMEAWKAKLKGVTVYVDGSRDGVLISTSDKEENKDTFSYIKAIKRPVEIKAFAHTTQVGTDKYSVFVGTINGLPYEVFAYKGGTKEGEGKMVKITKGEYQFIGDGEDSRHRIITGKMTEEQEMITRLLSGSLRHGRDIKFLVEDLNKTSGSLFSFNSAIARILKLYIPDGTLGGNTCPECGDDAMVYEEGCKSCTSCGYSAC